MIGIMRSQSLEATPSQPQNMDNDDPTIKSPSSGPAKKSMITSFFKPKTPKPSPETPLNSLVQQNEDGPPISSKREILTNDCDHPEKSTSKVEAPSKGQRLEVISKGKKCGDGSIDPRKDASKQGNRMCLEASVKSEYKGKDDDTNSCKRVPVKSLNAATFGSFDGKPRKRSNSVDVTRISIGPNGDGKSSKKRKKNAGLNSSSDDFEVDKRTKWSKKEPRGLHRDQEVTDDEVQEMHASDVHGNDAATSGSDEDIFEVDEAPANPKVISYLDFLNETMEKSEDEDIEIAHLSKNGIKDKKEIDGIENADAVDAHHATKDVPKEDKSNQKIHAHSAKKKMSTNVKKLNKLSSSTKTEEALTESFSDAKTTGQKEVRGDKQSSVSKLPDDDSVLTISYSEYLEDKSGNKPRESLPLPPPYRKQKLVTIEAEVHTPPLDQALHPYSGNNSPVNTSPVTIDLCHSSESQQTPLAKKRTSNVVVSLSDLDLMIVSTEDASAAADSRKSKTVYSIFQKKGTMEKPEETESKTLKKSQHAKMSKDSQGALDVKPKGGQRRKRLKDADLSPATTPKALKRKSNKTVEKAQAKTENGRRVKRALKTIFDTKLEEENTEEEFEEEMSKKSKEVSNRRRGKPKRLGSSSDEGQEETRGRALKKTFQLGETVVMTSTPKAKDNKKAKAQQLLRRAKSRQMNRASPLPFQAKVAQQAIQATKAPIRIGNRKGKLSSQTPKLGSRNQAGNLQDLTHVLGKKVTPKEVVDAGNVKGKTKKGVAKGRVVVEDVQARKPTKLAPMFTKEGRLALAKKQKTSEGQTSDVCVMVITDDDEASRDSIWSDAGGDIGGAKLVNDAFPRTREYGTDRSYPPFPAISHVLQMVPEMEGNLDWWKLPAPGNWRKFPMMDKDRKLFGDRGIRIVDRLMGLGEFTLCSKVKDETTLSKNFTGHPELSHNVQRLILDQIKGANPRFPVNRVFKRYLAKRKGEPLTPKLSQGETVSVAQCSPQTGSNFTKLKAEKPSAKRKSKVSDQRGNTKRRKVTQEGSAENSEVEFTGKIRLRRRSSRWVIRDDEDEEKQDAIEQPKPRRSSGQSEQAAKRDEQGSKEAKEGRTQRTRRGKNAAKEEAGKDGKKEGLVGAEGAKTKETQADKLASLPWTEKYQPATGAEIIGNAQAMKRLTGWLTEWKKKTARIKKKMKRQRGRQQNKTLLTLPVEDSDSDFDLGSDSDSSDSDDDDDSLSNAMLIVGPSGCGKTAAVYACAKELGFKVFEVNASSKRTGRQILADLGEATQSHHLSAHHHGNNNSAPKSFFPAKSPPRLGAKPEAKKTAIPKAFAAFYKAGADAAATKQTVKKTKAPPTKSPKKSLAKAAKPALKTPSSNQAVLPSGSKDGVPTQRLTSTSLILFEDVDVVFDEDKGFLSAIATFLRTTKRPIILTTSDGCFPEMFEERYEMVTFRKPPSLQLATHLQLLCLAENVYASHSDLHRVVSLLDCDVRRCWLAGQFWVGSGAGQITHHTSAPRTNDPGTSKEGKAEIVAADVTQKMEKSAMIPGGDDSVDGVVSSTENRSCSAQLTMLSGCYESIMGLCNLSTVEREVSSMLKIHGRRGSCLHTRATVAETFQRENSTSVHFRNIQSLLPPIAYRHSEHANQESFTDQSRTGSKAQTTNGRTVHMLNHKLVTSLATFADNISFMDSHTLSPVHDGKGLGDSGWWGAKVKPTLVLDPAASDGHNFATEETSSSIKGFLEAASFNCCYRNYKQTVEQLQQLPRDSGCQGEMQINNTKPDEIYSRLEQDGTSCLKLHDVAYTKCPELYPTLVNKLPLCTRLNHRPLALDYLPTLRCVCRSEQIREEMKIKRRFLHYLDSISLNLKKTDHIALGSIMEVKPPRKREDKPDTRQDGQFES